MKSRYKKILVGIDGTKESDKAFYEAVEMAKDHEADLIIAWINTEMERNPAHKDMSDREQLIYDRKVSKKEAEAKSLGVRTVTPIVATGDPRKYLSKWLPKEHQIDLIILGATTKKVFANLLVGSTAKYVVEYATCPVFVVK